MRRLLTSPRVWYALRSEGQDQAHAAHGRTLAKELQCGIPAAADRLINHEQVTVHAKEILRLVISIRFVLRTVRPTAIDSNSIYPLVT